MSGTMDAGDSYTTDDTGNHQGSITYVLAVSCALIFLILIISYVSWMCKRCTITSQSPPDDGDHQLVTISGGVDDEVLKTFPVFAYSKDTVSHMKGDDNSACTDDVNGAGCSICLADYKPANVIRLLPKCGHLFHSKCIDTWLKVHATCPVCRNSPLPVQVPGKVPLSIRRS